MNRKFFIIIFVAVPLVIIGFLFFWSRGKKNVEPPPPAEPEASLAPEQGRAAPVPLSAGMVISPVLSFSGDTVWYGSTDGKLYRQALSGEGEQEFPLPEPMYNLVRIEWQDDGSNFIIEQNQAGRASYKLYDADAARFLPYPEQMRGPRFLRGGRQIVYDWALPDGKHELKISDASGDNFKKITDLPRADYHIAVSSVKNEAVLYANNAADPSEIVLYDIDTGAAKIIAGKGSWTSAQFSPDGTRVLAVARGKEVIVINAATASVEAGIDATAAAWLPNGSGLVAATSQGFIRYSLASKEIVPLFEQPDLEALEFLLHPEQQFLLYKDSERLYRLDF